MVVEERPSPTAGDGQLLVRIRAAGVNYVDGLMCEGRYQIKFPTPYVPGGEIAGDVTAIGAGTSGFKIGDRVMAMTGFGAFCEEMALPALNVLPIPSTFSYGQAASMIQSYATALYSLKRAELQPGEKVLILGAGGGIGLAAVDCAVALGARVIAAASTKEKLEAAVTKGAEAVISYEDDDLKVRARELSGGGVDVVIDPVGGDKSEAALRALGRFGRFCVIGFTSGEIARIPLNQVLLSNRNVLGIDWGAWAGGDPEGNRKLIEEVLELGISPVVPREVPLSDVVGVMADLIDRKVVGKVVVVP
jgi:NADPH2:quinone reductase